MKDETVKHETRNEEKVVTISESEFRKLGCDAYQRICEKDEELLKKNNDKMNPGMILMNVVISSQFIAELHNLMFSDKTEETNESEDKE